MTTNNVHLKSVEYPIEKPVKKCEKRVCNLANHESHYTRSELPKISNRPGMIRRPGYHKFWKPVNSCKNSPEKEIEGGKRLMIFIDNSFAFLESRQQGIRLDHRRLVEFLSNVAIGRFDLQKANVYCTIDPAALPEKVSQTKRVFELFTTFPKFGVKVIELRTTQKNGEASGLKFETGLDVALTADLLYMAYQDLFDVAILCVGDEAYIPAIVSAQKMQKKIYVATYNHNILAKFSEIAEGTVSLSENVKEIEQVISSQPIRPSTTRDALKKESHLRFNASITQRPRVRYNGWIKSEV